MYYSPFPSPHLSICTAPPGTTKVPSPCQSDSECLDMEACYESLCQDPCEFAKACAPTAKCQAMAHRPVCTCPSGYEGNPAVKCFQSEPCKATKNNYCLQCPICSIVPILSQKYL